MAHGGYGRGAGIALQERREVSPAASRGTPPSRHCWVRDRLAGTTAAGLLLEWRRGGTGWEGRVVFMRHDGARWVTIEAWLPAGDLSSSQ